MLTTQTISETISNPIHGDTLSRAYGAPQRHTRRGDQIKVVENVAALISPGGATVSYDLPDLIDLKEMIESAIVEMTRSNK